MVAEVREAQRLKVLLLKESYAMLIPEGKVVLVGMRARKTVRMCRSSKSHVRHWLARTR
jgi:hypothetical protein